MSINTKDVTESIFIALQDIERHKNTSLDPSIQWLELFINLDEDLFLQHNTFLVQNPSGYRVMMDFFYCPYMTASLQCKCP